MLARDETHGAFYVPSMMPAAFSSLSRRVSIAVSCADGRMTDADENSRIISDPLVGKGQQANMPGWLETKRSRWHQPSLPITAGVGEVDDDSSNEIVLVPLSPALRHDDPMPHSSPCPPLKQPRA